MTKSATISAHWITLSITMGIAPIIALSIIGILFSENTSTCDWSCQFNSSSCLPGELPFCPESNLTACEYYFLRAVPNPCPFENIRKCSPCTLYFVSFGQ